MAACIEEGVPCLSRVVCSATTPTRLKRWDEPVVRDRSSSLTTETQLTHSPPSDIHATTRDIVIAIASSPGIRGYFPACHAEVAEPAPSLSHEPLDVVGPPCSVKDEAQRGGRAAHEGDCGLCSGRALDRVQSRLTPVQPCRNDNRHSGFIKRGLAKVFACIEQEREADVVRTRRCWTSSSTQRRSASPPVAGPDPAASHTPPHTYRRCRIASSMHWRTAIRRRPDW
jgi:hypothetical protein